VSLLLACKIRGHHRDKNNRGKEVFVTNNESLNGFPVFHAIDDHNGGTGIERIHIVENHRGEPCALPVGYVGHLCINHVYFDDEGMLHLSRCATYTLDPPECNELQYGWSVDIELWEEMAQIRLLNVTQEELARRCEEAETARHRF
jgi:hypothetical protein